jgi:hypothetical protein
LLTWSKWRSGREKKEKFIITWIMKKGMCTGKSFSEALILALTNPQYDKRLFIELQVQYMKTTSSVHENYKFST